MVKIKSVNTWCGPENSLLWHVGFRLCLPVNQKNSSMLCIGVNQVKSILIFRSSAAG
jgi:hypothetical protein